MRKSPFSVVVVVVLSILFFFLYGEQSINRQVEMSTVSTLNLNRYVGLWYEIARLPQVFEPQDCVGVTAFYSLRTDGKINVKNTCIRATCNGKLDVAKGVARVVGPGKLKVTFFPPFEGDYWIFELSSNYQYSVVGSPDKKSFWVLSRTPTLSKDILVAIIQRFSAEGFDFHTLEYMHPCVSV